MMTAAIIYLSIGLAISIGARALLGDTYKYLNPPWKLHTVVIFMWLPAVIGMLMDIGRRRK